MDQQTMPSVGRQRQRRVLWEAFAWTLVAVGTEIGLGWWYAGSVALLSDAFHVSHHLAAILVGLVALHAGERTGSRATQERIEGRATAVLGLLLLAAAIPITWEALAHLLTPAEIVGGTMLGTAVFGAIANARTLWILQDADGCLMRGVRLHTAWDFASSIVAVICGVLIVQWKMWRADAIGGLVLAAGIAWSGLYLICHTRRKHVH